MAKGNFLAEEQAWSAYYQADRAWSAELRVRFGKRAGDVRYTLAGNGEPGSILRELYNDYVAKRTAWYVERDREAVS